MVVNEQWADKLEELAELGVVLLAAPTIPSMTALLAELDEWERCQEGEEEGGDRRKGL